MTLTDTPIESADFEDEAGGNATEDVAAESAELWQAIEVLTQVAEAAQDGDFEARLTPIGDDPRLQACRNAINGMLDRADAYVRESSASLAEAAQHRYHRRFVMRGLDGAFRKGAATINSATETMAETDAALREAQEARQGLGAELENAIGAAVDQVAAASTQIEATAGSLAQTAATNSETAQNVAARAEEASEFMGNVAATVEEIAATAGAIDEQTRESSQAAHTAVSETEAAQSTFDALLDASKRIGDVVALIGDVAEQTRLLAFNATIEAARAGESGKGFAVVASEVKELATQTADATHTITNQIEQIQTASSAASTAVQSMTESLAQMGTNAEAIASAVAEQRVALGEMAKSSSAAATAASEVTDGVSDITSATQLTTDAASDLTSAALELSEMSGSLQVTVADVVQRISDH